MNSFWDNFYDAAKDRRYGTLFFSSLLGVFGLVVLLAWIYSMTGLAEFEEVVLPALAGVAVFVVVLSCRAIQRARRQQRDRTNFARLSRDEMAKARSKLGNKMIRPVRRPPTRAPDTNLKY